MLFLNSAIIPISYVKDEEESVDIQTMTLVNALRSPIAIVHAIIGP